MGVSGFLAAKASERNQFSGWPSAPSNWLDRIDIVDRAVTTRDIDRLFGESFR